MRITPTNSRVQGWFNVLDDSKYFVVTNFGVGCLPTTFLAEQIPAPLIQPNTTETKSMHRWHRAYDFNYDNLGYYNTGYHNAGCQTNCYNCTNEERRRLLEKMYIGGAGRKSAPKRGGGGVSLVGLARLLLWRSLRGLCPCRGL
jgi:hypothetical protein